MTSANQPPGMVGRRYIVQDRLGAGGMGVVYTALDSFTGKQVALKKSLLSTEGIATIAPTKEDTEFRLLLVNEFKILAGLRHPNIISVLDYGFAEDKSPYFTMELLQGAKSLRDAGYDESIEYKVGLLVQILQALAYLHRHNILHRDLKPGNVLVVDNEVRVLDFGIAMLRKQAMDEHEQMVAGTLGYIAPEVLRGEEPTPGADLYAVGVMAHELFMGTIPFMNGDTNKMYQDILFTPLEIPEGELDDGLRLVIERLMLKSSDDRYTSALEVIQAFNEATNLNFPVETAATRSSFLEAAPFAGREAEITRLLSELDQAFDGEGRAWLLAGESGVGKSRLLDELRIHAMVDGANVLRGHAISEGGNPYQVWHDVIFRLSILSDITAEEASILAPINPKIAALASDENLSLPDLEGNEAQNRMFRTIENLFARQKDPLLVILSDLHWADDESLQLLARLIPIVGQTHLMLVGSYRDDESPRLPEKLPNVNLMKLKRLDASGVEEVLSSMLGDVGRNTELVGLLERETEGNMFFLLEVVRALAEEAGGLGQIDAKKLPEKVVTGGVQAIIDRRLDRIPLTSRPLLDLAAVAGRQLDLAILQKLEPGVDFDEWLSAAAEAAVLVVDEETWRFAHNKVRDRIVADIEEKTLRQTHRRLAEAIESVYPTGEGQYAALAQHWEWAQELEKACRWYKLAGKQSEEAYAPIKAIEYYQKALGMMGEGRKAARERVEIYTGLGHMLRWQTRFDEAKDIYGKMESEAEDLDDKVARARALIGMSDVMSRQGDSQASLDYAQQAESVAREGGTKAREELVEALANKAWGYFLINQYNEGLAPAQEALDLARKAKLRPAESAILNTLGILNFVIDKFEESETYMKEAVEIARELGDKRDMAVKLNNMGDMRRLRGDSEGSIPLYNDALKSFREIGHRDNELAALSNLGAAYTDMRDFKAAENHLRQVVNLSDGKDWWGLRDTFINLAEVTFAQSNLAEATLTAQRALTEGTKADDKNVMGKAWFILAQTSARLGMYMEIDGKNVTADGCFERASNCFAEDNPEKARIVEKWAIFEDDFGDATKARTLFKQAVTLYTGLSMTEDTDRIKRDRLGEA